MIPCIIFALGSVALNVSALAYVAADEWRWHHDTLDRADAAQLISIAAAYLGCGLLLTLVVIGGERMVSLWR